MTSLIASAISAVALVSAAATAAVLAWRARRPLESGGAPPPPGALSHPWTLFVLTGAAALANQVVFNAYILAAHGGDPSFAGRYLGRAYFHLDLDFPGVRAIAGAFGEAGAESFLSPSLLRVNALLELPFAVFAYLAITRLFDRGAARFLLRGPLGWLGAASFTLTLCLIEILLHNPWTTQDLWLRVASFALLAPALRLLGHRERGAPCFPDEDGRPRSLLTLLIALGGAVAMAGSLLLLYDVTLLYNLAHLRQIGLPLLALLGAGTASVVLGPRLDARNAEAPPPASVAAMTSVASAFALSFFVPSLAVRYGLGQPVSELCGVVVLGVAVVWGLIRAARAPGIHRERWLLGLSGGALAGGFAVAATWSLLSARGCPEAPLVGHAVFFLGPFLFTWRALEALGLDPRRD